MTDAHKKRIINFIQNMPASKWQQFEGKFNSEERGFVIFLIQNQKGGTLETDGVSYREETHTKFRKLLSIL